jgi:hypothetical protein
MICEMNPEELKTFVDEGLSARKIAARLGVSFTTVRYWLRKFGLKTKFREDKPLCKNCGKPVKRRPSQYCSCSCYGQSRRLKIVESDTKNIDPRLLKRHLLETRGHRCEVCGITEWMGRAAPLELDHKDGNPFNNDLSNLRLICPNCHSQTHTYKNRNMGRGRFYRRHRYAEGKSH